MADDTEAHRKLLQDLYRERAGLLEQIEQSQKTIERSQALLKRIDEMLEAGLTRKP